MSESPYDEAVPRHPLGTIIPVALRYELDRELRLRLGVRLDGEELPAQLAFTDWLPVRLHPG